MGNFDMQYKSYYEKKIGKGFYKEVKQNTPINTYKVNNHLNNEVSLLTSFLAKVKIQSFVVLIITSMILSLRIIETPYNMEVNSFLVKYIKQKDVSYFKDGISIQDIESIQDNIIEQIENIRSNITGDENIFKKIKDEYIKPAAGVSNKMLSSKKTKGKYVVVNSIDENVFASYDAKVKEVGKNEDGKYIILNHGEGIETVYLNLSKVYVKKGDYIKKSHKIGSSKKSKSDNKYEFVFKLLFMGGEKDPQEYIFD